jgi:hypothetical protein
MRFQSLARSRVLSLLLLALSPALAGTALPVLHPCPVDAPVADQGSGHAGHHTAPAQPPASHGCTCIGSCLGSAVPHPGGPSLAQRVRLVVEPAVRAGPDATLVLAPIAVLLPPAIAPPRA